MGVWGGLCVFNYAKYTHTVLPAFQAGELHPLVQHTLRIKQHHHPHHPMPAFHGLAALVAACDSLMTSCALGRVFSVCDGVISLSWPRNPVCDDRWGYEEVADLFERVLTRATITHYTIFGLAFTAVRQLLPPELGLDPDTHTLLDLLDNRCEYWAAGSGGYGEGPRGWLDPAETGHLLRGLSALAAPVGTPFTTDPPHIPALFQYCGESEGEYAHHLRHIQQFLAILQQAAAHGHGVLWGRDLKLFYSTDGLFTVDEARPVELV